MASSSRSTSNLPPSSGPTATPLPTKSTNPPVQPTGSSGLAAKLQPGVQPIQTVVPTTTGSEKLVLRNRANESRSPYVRGHASNPVHWQQWNDEAIDLAKRHNRMIFLSIGYAACHWCHVMERESFENEAVAAVLNENFISIKVDREERPDIDRIYMNFLQATTGSGGWPLNVFLTPDLKPVFGGTYWPGPNTSTPGAHQQPGFLEILRKIVGLWTEQRSRVVESANDVVKQLREFADEGNKTKITEEKEGLEIDLLEEAYQYFQKLYDPEFGGFGLEPKFPTPVNLSFLLRLDSFQSTVQDIVGDHECDKAKEMALTTLKNMANGGIHDQIGHGFARYSVTADWNLPHFEKMLYDQAQLLDVYLDAYLITGDKLYRDTAVDVADYITEDALHREGGGYFSSEDADSFYRKGDADKREGAFYVWTRKEFDEILGKANADIASKYWNVDKHGNVDSERDAHDEFLDQNVLSVVSTPAQLAQQFKRSESEILEILKTSRAKLLAHRNAERVRPLLDDKVVTSWNGLAIGSLARAGVILAQTFPEKAKKYLASALETAAFLRETLYDEKAGTIKRVFRERPGTVDGFCDDYAFLIHGLIELYQATFDPQFLQWAESLQERQIALFHDPTSSGFFATPSTQTDLILRLKDGLDSQEPSINGVTSRNLLALSTLLNKPEYQELATSTIQAFSIEILQHPFLFTSMLPGIVTLNLGCRSCVIAGNPSDPEVERQLAKVRCELVPDLYITFVNMEKVDGDDEGTGWLLERNELLKAAADKVRKTGKAFVEVCAGGRCEIVGQVERAESRASETGEAILGMGDLVEVIRALE